MKLLYGTTNPAKLSAMARVLAGLGVEVLGLKDMEGQLPVPKETGSTLLENARLKARAYYERYRMPVFSCDSGLYLEGLPDELQPGLHVRSPKGEYLTDRGMLEYYGGLARQYGDIRARYRNAVCLILDEDHVYESMDESLASAPFWITSTPHPQRREGFPLDSLSKDIRTGQYYYDQGRESVDELVGDEGFAEFFRRALKIPPDRVKGAVCQTHNRFLNLYEFQVVNRLGRESSYFVATRNGRREDLKAFSHGSRPDGVIIYAVHGEKKDRLVLVRQFRYPINDYIYEFPAGLVEPGEDMYQAGVREIYEETGLCFVPKKADPAYSRPFYTTVGMTDECCGTVYGYCSGEPTNRHQEDSEDIQIVLADREECRRILREENVAIMCAYMLMHFVHEEEGDPLGFLEG